MSRGTAQSRRGRYEMKGCLGAFRQTFTVASSPESVFDPPNLGDWQTSKTRVEVLSEGEPRAGIPGAGEDQVARGQGVRSGRRVHLEFDRPTPRLHPRGPLSSRRHVGVERGRRRHSRRTRVEFVAEGSLSGLMRLVALILTRLMARHFATYHENLRRNVESRT